MFNKVILVLIVAFALPAFAESGLDGNWTTDYLPGHGRFALQVKDGAASLQVDRNMCQLNEVGLPLVCTKMAIQLLTGSLEWNSVSGRYPRGTAIYRIDGTNFGIVYSGRIHYSNYRLIEYGNEGRVIASYRLNSAPAASY